MGLRHLQPDRPTAQDQQVARRLLQGEQRLVGQEGHRGQAGDGGDDGGGTGGDDGAAEMEPVRAGVDDSVARFQFGVVQPQTELSHNLVAHVVGACRDTYNRADLQL